MRIPASMFQFAAVLFAISFIKVVIQRPCYMKFERQSFESTAVDSKAISSSRHDHNDLRQHGEVLVDELVWYAPRPLVARLGGWEDDFMRKWKESQYNPAQRLSCQISNEGTPYDFDLLCPVPAYVPARLPLPQSSQLITRVIFISWTTRILGRSFFTSVKTILHHNPEYELIFFDDDDDIDRFVCQNYPDLVPHFSKLRSGASRVDVWRMMVI
jgi:hypothetical protein